MDMTKNVFTRVAAISLFSTLLLAGCNLTTLEDEHMQAAEISDEGGDGLQGGDNSEEINVPERKDCLADVCYRVTFTEVWSQSNFPVQYPAGSHFSRLTGVSHGPAISFYDLTQSASQGIEDMAETGGVSQLKSEFNSAINGGTAFSLIEGGGIPNQNNETQVDFTVTDAYPLVTLVSMLAPSPDWFVGVNGLNLKGADGKFQNNLIVDLLVYDAGTDSGVTYSSANSDENSVITLLSCNDLVNDCGFSEGVGAMGVANETYIGTFEFERIY